MNTKAIQGVRILCAVSVLSTLTGCVGRRAVVTADRMEDRYDRRENRYDRRVWSGPGDHLENRYDRREGIGDKARGRYGL